MRFRKLIRFFFGAVPLGCGLFIVLWMIHFTGVQAQMVPETPIHKFRLPMFGENGYKTWELRGLSGEYVDKSEAIVESLDLRVFSGDASMNLENRILSPRAHIYFDESRAVGSSSLFVSGPGFEIEGRNWIWDGLKKTIFVKSGARVTFEEEIDILK